MSILHSIDFVRRYLDMPVGLVKDCKVQEALDYAKESASSYLETYNYDRKFKFALLQYAERSMR